MIIFEFNSKASFSSDSGETNWYSADLWIFKLGSYGQEGQTS